MSSQKMVIPHAQDRALIDAFAALARDYACSGLSVQVVGSVNIGPINLSAPEADPALKFLLERRSDLIWNAGFTVAQCLTITFYRGGSDTNPNSPSPYWDHLTLAFNEGSPSRIGEIERIKIAGVLGEKLGAVTARKTKHASDDRQEQLLALHDEVLKRLEVSATGLIEDAAEHRRELEREFSARRDQLDAEGTRYKENLDQRRLADEERLSEREAELELRIKSLDDRDNKHARRAIRDKMLEDVKDRIRDFGVSTRTEGKRAPVRAGIFLLALLFLGLWVLTGLEIWVGPGHSSISVFKSASGIEGEASIGSQLALWVRFALATVGLSGTLIFYIKWENRWADLHAANEFQLQQFHIDVNRANWVIESSLEWKKETHEVIPAELLKEISKNLFTDRQSEPDKVIHPADELASALLGSASKLKLNVAGNEIEFNKPGKIAKTVTTEKPAE